MEVRFGKREGLPHVTTNTLPQRLVPTLHMCRFPGFLPNTTMGFCWEDLSIGYPEVAKGVAVFVRIGNRSPEA